MPEGINPKGGDALSEITRGRVPTDEILWPEDYDKLVQKKARNGHGAHEPVAADGDPLDILIQREENSEPSDKKNKTVGWSNYKNDGKVGDTVTRVSADVIGLRKGAGRIKPERYFRGDTRSGVREKRRDEVVSFKRGKAKRK